MNSQGEATPGPMLDSAGWHKTLTWRQGFYMALTIASGAFVSSGYMIGAIGAWGSLLICGIMGVVALLSNFLFAEMASMFPDQPGSLSVYASEGLRRYFIPGGVLAAFGYWLGYSLGISFNALWIGLLIQTQWFPEQTWSVGFLGGVRLTLAHVFAAGLILVCWVLTLLGIKLAARISTVIGIISLAVVAVVIIGPLVAGHVSLSSLSMHLPGWRGTGVWLYLAGSTLFASEIAAAFAPEYRDPKRDVPRALLSSAIFLMLVYSFTPFAAATVLGEQAIGQNPMTYGPLAAAHVFGGSSAVFTLALVACLIVSTLLFVNDAGRATAGMADEGETLKQFARLNRFGAPTWGTHVVIIVNIGVLLFVANPLGILLASNLGYILAHSLANWSFVILRKSQPDAPRPFKLKSPLWMPIAVTLGLFHLFILYVGVSSPGLAGYGGLKETLIAVGILLSGLIFWVIRVVVQDRRPLRLRDRTTEDPGTAPSAACLACTSTETPH